MSAALTASVLLTEAHLVLVGSDIIIFSPASHQSCGFAGHPNGVHHGVSVQPKVRETRSSSLQGPRLPELLNGFSLGIIKREYFLYESYERTMTET